MKATRRVLSILLVLCMLLGVLPSTVFAASGSTSFSDVKESDWYYDAVTYVSDNELMSGTGNNMFSPLMTTTRSMIVTILYRLEGSPAVTGTSTFSDVAAGQFYTNGTIWAAQNGIVNGYDNGLFAPNDVITREQMAAILYRYAQYKEYAVATTGDITTFTDSASVSPYAVDALKWAVGAKLLAGVGNNTLLPGGSATRAEIATILMRFCQTVAQ